MHPRVTCKAVEREIAAKFRLTGRRFSIVEIRLAPNDGVDVQPRKSSSADFVAEFVQRDAKQIRLATSESTFGFLA